MKIKLAKHTVTPVRWSDGEGFVETVEKIPVWAKPFMVNTPAEFLRNYIAKEKLEMIAGAMYGFADIGMTVPEWSKKASIQFWKNYIGNGGPLRPKESVEDFGVLAVMLEKFVQGHFLPSPTNEPLTKLEKFLGNIAKKICKLLSEKIISKLSHEEKAQFYIGCAKGEKIIVRMQNPDHLAMVKRAQVYIAIAAVWRQFEKFPSHAAAERWLRDQKIIGDEDKFSSREVYAVFEVIELPGAAAGRPKNLKTRCAEITES